jgi:CelD/BcsL family acetyltransferase involved in cellulose biosynthesis
MQQIQEHQLKVQNAGEDGRIDDTIDVQIYDNFEALANMQRDWDSFMEEINAEIFLTYDWCKLWWKYYGKGRDLKIFTFKQKDQIIGILPLFRETFGQWPIYLNVVKIVCTDFMPTTIILPVSHDYLSLVIPAFLNRISALWSWDALHIGDLSGSYKQLDKLSEILSKTLSCSYKIECKETGVQTYFEIANSFEDQLKTLSARQRTKTKRVYKELQDKDITLKSIAADEQNYLSFLDAFIDMHQAHWQSLGIAGHFVDWPHARELHKDIASAQIKHNRLRILKIMLNDQCIGYEYIYKFGNTYCWFLSARTDLSDFPRIDFHRIAFGEKINHAISDKVKWIDALRGYYEYKLVMGGQLKPMHSIIVYSNNGVSNFRYQVFKRSAWLLNVIYMKIWRRRLVPRLGMRPKSLLKIWIKTGMFSR